MQKSEALARVTFIWEWTLGYPPPPDGSTSKTIAAIFIRVWGTFSLGLVEGTIRNRNTDIIANPS